MAEGSSRLRIGIDTGGTFTDVVAVDETTGEVFTTKTPSIPENPSRAVLEGLRKVLRLAGQSAGAVAAVSHGTTVATNALLEERFDGLALVTTAGFRHVLEIARQSVPQGYGNSYFWVKPERIVPLHRVSEVPERVSHRGAVLREFDEAAAIEVAERCRRQGVSAIGVSFLHGYANRVHEQRMRAVLERVHPTAHVSISSEVWPEYREYERTVTTLVDAFAKGRVERGGSQERVGGGRAKLPLEPFQAGQEASHPQVGVDPLLETAPVRRASPGRDLDPREPLVGETDLELGGLGDDGAIS